MVETIHEKSSSPCPVSQSPIGVLCVDDDESRLELLHEAIGDEFDVHTTTGFDDALDVVRDVDCVVSTQMVDDRTGVELFEAIRDRGHEVPCLLFPADASRRFADQVLDVPATDVVSPEAPGSQYRVLQHRIRRMVAATRRASLAESLALAARSVREGIAIAGPDGTFRFVDNVYARRFGYSPSEMIGRDWRSVYTDAEVDRLESNVLPTVEDSWRWSGSCTGRRKNGETFPRQTSLLAQDDGSLVFVHPP